MKTADSIFLSYFTALSSKSTFNLAGAVSLIIMENTNDNTAAIQIITNGAHSSAAIPLKIGFNNPQILHQFPP